MNNKRLIAMISTIVVVSLLLVFFLNSEGSDQTENTSNPEPPYTSKKWEPKLKLDNRDPYGLYVMSQLLTADSSITAFNEFTDYRLLDSLSTLDSSLYMYVGIDFTLTNDEMDILLEGVARGNDFFLSVEHIPYNFLEKTFDGSPLTFNAAEKAVYTVDGDSYPMYYIYEQDTLTEQWDLLHQDFGYKEVLTTTFDHPVYVKFEWGKGHIFMHMNPVTFTNTQLLRQPGKDYFKSVVSTFEHSRIQWLTFARYEPVPYDIDASQTPGNENILSELFKFTAFRWAFILAIIGIILYFVFRSKRRRPIIPAVSTSSNDGFSYVDTLAGIYYEKAAASKVLKMMRKNFYDAVERHFYIDLAHRKNQRPVVSLAQKSGVPLKKIERLLSLLEKEATIAGNYLSQVNRLQREFYIFSGIWGDDVIAQLAQQDIQIYRSKSQSTGVLVSGILIIIFGFIFLSLGIGWGVLLWPAGIFIIIVATRMMRQPILILREHEIAYKPVLGTPITLNKKDISSVLQDGGIIKIYANQQKIILNLNTIEDAYHQTIKALKTK